MTAPSTFPGVRPSWRPSVRMPAAEPLVKRVQSVDLLRGLVMIIMALDHVRDYFTRSHFDPTDLTQTTVPLFLTRWITHYCAPTFVLLAGVSAWMAGRRRSTAELSYLLFTRGLWLVLLELTVVNFGWFFNFGYDGGVHLQVIWAIGISMIALAPMVRLSRGTVGLIGLALITGHNLLDRFDAQLSSNPLWALLHLQKTFPDLHLFVTYPILPWIGVIAVGYALGAVLERPAASRDRILMRLGLGAIAGFVLLRAIAGYGDPHPWLRYDDPGTSALSFLNVTKYPPSLEFLLMTLGPALVGLVALERIRGVAAEWLQTFGKAPFFYYIGHIYLIHALALVAGELTGFGVGAMTHGYRGLPAEYGFSLPVVYLVWVGVLAAMYRPTRWFGELKAKRREWWWAYL